MMEEKNLSILLVDDHSMVRSGLRAILEQNGRYTVAGEAGTGREAVELLAQLKPDIVILDINLPDQSGLNCIARMKEIHPACSIMMLSMYSQQNYIDKALAEGARAYLLKESGQEKLLKALAAIEEGDIYIDGKTAEKRPLSRSAEDQDLHRLQDTAYESLTAREQEVMVMLAEGLSVKEIAGRIYISARTVENHRSAIFRKLGIQSIIELVRYASRIGLIDLDSWK